MRIISSWRISIWKMIYTDIFWWKLTNVFAIILIGIQVCNGILIFKYGTGSLAGNIAVFLASCFFAATIIYACMSKQLWSMYADQGWQDKYNPSDETKLSEL